QITRVLRKALSQAGTLQPEDRLSYLMRLSADVEEMRMLVEHQIGQTWIPLDASKPYQHGVESHGKQVGRERYGLSRQYYYDSRYFGSLTPEELNGVITWIRSTYRVSPPTIRSIVDELRTLRKQ